MTVKESAKHVIDTLPEDVSMDDVVHALYVNIKFAHGESEIRDGKGVPQQDARRRLDQWLK